MNEPTPTEKSQIVVNYTFASPAPVFRFNSVKKGEKEFAKLKNAWSAYSDWMYQQAKGKKPSRHHDVDGDMFVSTIDLACIACLSFVDLPKRAKFIPAP